MTRRRLPVGNVLLAVYVVAGSGGGSGEAARTVVTGFSAPPQPSTSWGRQPRTPTKSTSGSSSSRADTVSGVAASRHRHRRRYPCSPLSLSTLGSVGGGNAAALEPAPATSAVSGALQRLSPPRSLAAARVSALAARPPTSDEMDAEWEGILAEDEDEDTDDEEDDGEEDEGFDPAAMLTDEELFATDATEGGFLGGAGEEERDEEEEGQGSTGGRGGGRKPRVWYGSYKERMKAQKAKAAAWEEKRKTFSKAHNDYLDEAQRNREIAAAR